MDDPPFLVAFTRALRKELEDTQILNEINREKIEGTTKDVNRLSCETINSIRSPRLHLSTKNTDDATNDQIDQKRVYIEITHDPSKCAQRYDAFDHPGTFSFVLVRSMKKIFVLRRSLETYVHWIDRSSMLRRIHK